MKDSKFITQQNVPKTYEQFVLEEKHSEQEKNITDSYIAEFDFYENNVGSQKSYGPTGNDKKTSVIAFKYYSQDQVRTNRENNHRNNSILNNLLGSDLIGSNWRNRKSCVAIGCFSSVSEDECYCILHKLIVGEQTAELVKTCDKVASKEGGVLIVSQDKSGKEAETTVYYSNKK